MAWKTQQINGTPGFFNVIVIQLVVVDSEQLTLKFVKSAKIITQSFNDRFSQKYSEQGNLNICLPLNKFSNKFATFKMETGGRGFENETRGNLSFGRIN